MENNNVDTTKTITHLSLCSGYEGIGLGLRRVLPNLREIAYVEREGFPVANLVAKIEEGKLDAAPVYTDVKTFPYGEFRGCVDILSGGFPCQPFSAAGKRNGVEDPRHLFPYIADGIRECQPRIVFLENVQGILSCTTGDGEPVLQYVLRTLEEMGYRATAGIFSAEEVGAPHQRKRVFILGYSQHNGCASLKELRGDEEASDQWTKEESSKTRESEGASRPIDVPSVQGCTEGSKSEELAHRNNTGLEGHHLDSTSEQGEPIQADTWATGGTRWPSRPSEPQHDWEEPRVVVNSTSECNGLNETKRQGGNTSSQSSEELANPNNSGGKQDRQPAELWASGIEQSPIHRWPARPGETQQEWEEPRVVGNTQNINCDVSNDNGELGQSECRKPRGAAGETVNRGQAESRLGGKSNGSANRVDRLRLLGNGVVPATAAKAFVTLINRIYKHD